MKSQFLLAFNEICRDKQLPPETVLEALKNALVSAYRRDLAGAAGEVPRLDPRLGRCLINVLLLRVTLGVAGHGHEQDRNPGRELGHPVR